MISSRQLQRGAVTLIGALFIVIVLSVMAVSLLRMAGSNSLDSAVQNDAVEALFVAETSMLPLCMPAVAPVSACPVSVR